MALSDTTAPDYELRDPDVRLMVGSKVIKDHVVLFDEGRTVTLLVSPEGNVFPRITRDANRTREEPTLPENWRLIEYKLTRPMEFQLTGETTVIRTDNQDSFQGPVEFSFHEPRPETQQEATIGKASMPRRNR